MRAGADRARPALLCTWAWRGAGGQVPLPCAASHVTQVLRALGRLSCPFLPLIGDTFQENEGLTRVRPHTWCRRLTPRPWSQTQNRCHVHAFGEVRPRGLVPAHCSVPAPPLRDTLNEDPEHEGGERSPHRASRACGCSVLLTGPHGTAADASEGHCSRARTPAAEAAAPGPAVCGPRGVGAS